MAGSRKRNIGRVKEDRISVLPHNILETILCCLPIRDAVRTSVLSRNWRHCWTMIPNLEFDGDIICSASLSRSKCHARELNAGKFVSVINRVLLLHNGPILKFSLSLPSFCDDQIIHDYVDQWIPLFLKKGIQQLTLDGYDLGQFTAHNFSSLDLTHLRLANVWLPYPPASGGLTYLTIIELVGVSTAEQSIMDCPVLQKLMLLHCEGILPINFIAPNLKCLHQRCHKMTSEDSLVGFKNLTEFYYWLSSEPEMQTEIPNVVKASLTDLGEEGDFKDCWDEDYEDCSVDHLEIVTFSNFVGHKAELEFVKFLLAHSPVLKTMYINRDQKMENDVAVKILEEILKFSRASSRAEIKHLKDPVDAVNYGPWVTEDYVYG
ncbi:hypothetical protein ACET3Z_014013 [Daucus carota]